MYLELLSALGGSAILITAVSWLIKSLLSHILSKDIEGYKQMLSKDTQNHKQMLKTEFDKSIIEHDTIFRSLHAKRADIIADLHSQLFEVRNILNSINNDLKDQNNKELSLRKKPKINSRLMNKWSPCWEFYNKNRLYISPELSDKIENLLLNCLNVSILYGIIGNDDLSEFPLCFQKSVCNVDEVSKLEKISKWVTEFNLTIKEVENTFRSIVGINGCVPPFA